MIAAPVPMRRLNFFALHCVQVRFAFSDTDEREVRMMLGENAAALYGFDLEALRPLAETLGITPELVRQPLEEIPADSTCITFLRARAEAAFKS